MRTPKQIASRMLVFSALSARASFEATDDPRVPQFCKSLLPWLETIGANDELDPIERRILEIPYGELSKSEQADVNWASEGWAVMAWAISHIPSPPSPLSRADAEPMWSIIPLLRDEASKIITDSTVRPFSELQAYCSEVATILWNLREDRLEPDGRPVLARLIASELDGLRLPHWQSDYEKNRTVIAAWSAEQKAKSSAIHFVRNIAATWLIDDREHYFQEETP